MIHTVKGFGIVNKAEIDDFLELSCIFDDPADVGNLISSSSAFSKTSLNIWKFTVHVLLKPGLENFEHYFTSVWNECNCAVVWAFFGNAFFGIWMKTDLFQSCGHCWVFQICWHIECSTFTASSFSIWNSSTGIPSPPLALFIMMLPKAHLTSHSWCGFLHTTMQISHNYTYVPSFLSFSSLPSHPSRSSQSARVGSLYYTATSHQPSTPILHMIVYICWFYDTTFSIIPLSPSLSVSTSSFSTFVSLFPANSFINTIFLDFHVNALIHDIYFSLSDSLHSV